MGLKGLLCDLDGVVRHWPDGRTAAIEARYGLPSGGLYAAAFDPELLENAVTGAITDELWRSKVARRLELDHGQAAAAAATTWSALEGLIDFEMLELLAEARRNVPVALLTNATTRLAADLAKAGIGDSFDAIVNSSELGVAKPDPEIFRRAAQSMGLACHDCAFVDDTERHVEAARAQGMTAILHKSVEETRGELERLGLVQTSTS